MEKSVMTVPFRRRIKEKMVEEMSERWKDSNSLLFIDIEKVKSQDTHSLRMHLRKNDARMSVVKNSLFKLAMERNGIELPQEVLHRSTAVLWSSREIPELCKLFDEWRKDSEYPTVKGCYAYGKVWSATDFERFVKLPSKKSLQSNMLALLNGSLSGLLNLFQAQFMHLLLCFQEHYKKIS